mmetsp:Transcript_21752/g.47271  ORF Transcript_21752/g.47271 Transcript_21752/m.47271 type:complete len:427 (+) Transcript_21752:359-1639(+)|eukprot:CAMPEP_0172309262 /NCGR_PEP_ID=MMETSP1058-20130122/9610_1 /TAXON_ID=83371 /ORGANISM="Detonula confervacea, Strain CCMP 353" /LENGTH=426 /DNA_ID=CAMNT_0013021857 /DNA_START=139 /DNA_END=1419 /DNA_ORIENTATION=+
MKICLAYYLSAIALTAAPSGARIAAQRQRHLGVLSDASPSSENDFGAGSLLGPPSLSMSMPSDIAKNHMSETSAFNKAATGSSKSGKGQEQPPLVPSFVPGLLQNSDFGVVDPTKYNIDMSLQVQSLTTTDVYVNVRADWMKIITGDLYPVSAVSIPDLDECVNELPPVIDDLHVCIIEDEIDGPSGILGQAGPLWVRPDIVDESLVGFQTITGTMTIDIEDISFLVEQDAFEDLVKHEMGHIAGVGDWQFLVNGDFEYIGENAVKVWTDDWGCVGKPPVQKVILEDGTILVGAHWEEECFGAELMTPYADLGTKLSKLSIAAVEDLGYTVDYNAASDYDGSDTTCCSPETGNIASSTPIKPQLSDSGVATATAYGRQVLSQSQRPAEEVASIEEEEGMIMYVGDRFITVLIEENGSIFEVFVTNE